MELGCFCRRDLWT